MKNQPPEDTPPAEEPHITPARWREKYTWHEGDLREVAPPPAEKPAPQKTQPEETP
ncbi:MAG: hypothetical protein HZA93_24030 [Verrucomicrobia bacterium]|nr:hypothetical protein [Verrucomicrobiota bacterium]